MLLPKLRARIVVAPWVVPRKNVIQGVAQKNGILGICWGKVACLTYGYVVVVLKSPIFAEMITRFFLMFLLDETTN